MNYARVLSEIFYLFSLVVLYHYFRVFVMLNIFVGLRIGVNLLIFLNIVKSAKFYSYLCANFAKCWII